MIQPSINYVSQDRVNKVMQDLLVAVARQFDRMLACVLLLEWAVMLALAVCSARKKEAFVVWALFGITGCILPGLLAWRKPGLVFTRHCIAIGQMLSSAIFIHMSGGRIETHFHIFGSLALLAFYIDWKVLATASSVAFTDLFLRGTLFPQSVFGVSRVDPWRIAEHVGWLLFALSIFTASCIFRLKRMHMIAASELNKDVLLRQAYTDTLTELPNRLFFEVELAAQLKRASSAASMVSLLYIDLDGFKRVNDTLGHAAGDHVLREVASRLTEALGQKGILARIGGDEFVAILCEGALASSSQSIAGKLLGASLLPVQVGSEQVHLGASIGISSFPQDGLNGDELLQAADAAMYRVKSGGKRGYAFSFGPPYLTSFKVSKGVPTLQEAHSNITAFCRETPSDLPARPQAAL